MTTNAVYITNLASFLPNEAVKNDEIEDVLGCINNTKSRVKAMILRNNGIKSRYYAIDKKTGKLNFNNAQITAKAIANLASDSFSLDDIDCISCGTSLPDQIVPGHGVMVHGELGSPACEVHTSAGVCVAGMNCASCQVFYH